MYIYIFYSLVPFLLVFFFKVRDEEYYLVGSRDYAAHDAAWLSSRRLHDLAFGPGTDVNAVVQNISDDVHILHVAGPRSHEMLTAVCPDIGEIPFLQVMRLVSFL